METLCHSLIKNEVDYFWITIKTPNVPDSLTNISLLEESDSKISVDTSGDKPIIYLDIYLKGRILNVINETKTITSLEPNTLTMAAKEYLEINYSDYFKKTSTEYGCDIDGFYKVARRHFLTNQEWQNYDWSSKYGEAEFKVNVNINLFFSSSILQ